MDHDGLHYPNLQNCRIVLGAAPYAAAGDDGDSGEPAGPVSMPAEALRALNIRIPPPHDFTVERDVLKKKEERAQRNGGRSSRRSSATAASSGPSSSASAGSGSGGARTEREAVVQQMKTITQADRLTCASLLERTGYDLDRSVEAYFRGDR